MSRRLVLVFAVAAALLSSGCNSYPLGVTKAEWEQMSPAERSKALAADEKRVLKIQQSYPKDGPALSGVFKDDQQNRDRTPARVGP